MHAVEKLPAVTRRRVLLILSAVMVAAIIAAFYQSALIGWWRGEAKYKGRYTNSWRAELRCYKRIFGIVGGGLMEVHWSYERVPSKWEGWLAEVIPDTSQSKYAESLQLLNGDPAAIPVLVELLQAPETDIRIMAVQAMERLGSEAQDAIPALSVLDNDDDSDVRLAARQAIRRIEANDDE
jgi:hypothetical protein